MTLSLRYAARSDVGLVRTGNEDSGYAGPRLLVVADGMGGHAAGEVASSLVVGSIAALDDDDLGGDLLDSLADAVADSDRLLRRTIDNDPALEGMGTTLTALLWSGSRVGLAHVGDSRAYLLRGGDLLRLTHDHTYVQSLVDAGRISAEEAQTHPRRSLLTRAMDGRNPALPDLSVREVRSGDRFLLCSDGLTGVVSEETIVEALAADDPAEAAERLVALALRSGAPDNVTVVVADVEDDATTSTTAQVVGAAADPRLTERARQADDDSPAAKARRALAGPADAVEAERTQARIQAARDDERRERRGRWARRSVVAVVSVGVVVAAIAGAMAWIGTQYFVGVQDGRVTVFRGVDQQVATVSLSEPIQVTTVQVEELPELERDRVEAGIPAADLTAARDTVDRLAAAAASCALPFPPAGCPEPATDPLPTTPPTSTATTPPNDGTSSTPTATPAAAGDPQVAP
jgi:PPM family protein phosphatase